MTVELVVTVAVAAVVVAVVLLLVVPSGPIRGGSVYAAPGPASVTGAQKGHRIV